MNHTCINYIHQIPKDPTTRYHQLTHLKGLPIVLITTNHATEGVITHIARPDRTKEEPVPTITIDTGHGSVICEVHADDIITPPAGE